MVDAFTFLHGFSFLPSSLPYLYRLLRISTSLHHSQYLSIIIRVVKPPPLSFFLLLFLMHPPHIIITPSASIQKLPQAQPLVIRLSRSLSSPLQSNYSQPPSTLISISLVLSALPSTRQSMDLFPFSLSTIPTLRLLSSFRSFFATSYWVLFQCPWFPQLPLHSSRKRIVTLVVLPSSLPQPTHRFWTTSTPFHDTHVIVFSPRLHR